MQYGTKGERVGELAFESAAEATAAERDSRTLDYLITVIGFGLCRAWIVFCLGAPLVAGAASSFTWAYLLFGALSALAVSFVVNRSGKREGTVRVALFRFTPVALAASGIIIPLALWMGSEPLMVVGFVVGGLGAGPLQVLWGDRFARHATFFATIASPAAAIVTALVAGMSSDHTSLIGFAVIPLLSFGLLLFEANRTGLSWSDLAQKPIGESSGAIAADGEADGRVGEPAGCDRERERDCDPSAKFGVGKLMFSIMTFSFLCRLFDAMPSHVDPFSFIGGSAIFALMAVGVAFLLIAAKLRDRFNATLTYRLSLPIMVAGFVAIALFFDTHAAVSILLLIGIGYELFDIVTWILFVDLAQRREDAGGRYRVFGQGVAATLCGMGLGYLVGGELHARLLAESVQMSTVGILCVTVLVVTAFLVIPEGTIAQVVGRRGRLRGGERDGEEGEGPAAGAADVGAPAVPPLEKRCEALAIERHLTPREGEVLVLLARGRTLAIVMRDLQIAKGTAQTHIENVYAKLGVHKQQELIDLVEGCELKDEA